MASRRTARTAQALWEEVDDLKQQLGAIVKSMEASLAAGGTDAKQVVEDKGRTFLALATELVDSLANDTAKVVGAAAARTVSTVREIKDDGIDRLEEAVRERPLTAVVLSFGAGWVVARMTARR